LTARAGATPTPRGRAEFVRRTGGL